MKYLLFTLLLGCGGEEAPANKKAETKSTTTTQPAKTTPKSTAKAPAKTADTNSDHPGAAVYKEICVTCHLDTGKGLPGVYPPLAGSDWLTKDNEILIKIVLHGLKGEVVVNGKKYNQQMQPQGGSYDDKQVADVLSYVRSSWGNKLPAITPEEVAKVRAATADRKTQWTAEELLKDEKKDSKEAPKK